jgi:hypothetical protein
MMMEQILVCRLAKMNAMDERMEEKIGAEIKTNQERMEAEINDGQEEMKSHMDFLTPPD